MKKTFALFIFAIAGIAAVFAQDKPAKGDLIYGRVIGSDGPLVGIHVTEKNGWDRIMSEGVTDANGEFSFRLTNPDNRIVISRVGYVTKDLSINKKCYEINMKEQETLPPVQIIDGPPSAKDMEWMKEVSKKIQYEATIMTKDKRQDIYLPYRDNIHYGSIEELFNNMTLEF